jgi:hypothetical protein
MGTRIVRVLPLFLLLASALATSAPARAVTAAPDYRPDAWIKPCGWGDTCEHAPPHKFRGNDVYNRTGAHQTARVAMEEGTDVRFWILLQNDGALADTFTVQGCAGNAQYVVRVVNETWIKKASYRPVITGPWKRGTLTYDVPPTGTKHNIAITLDIWAKTSIQGARYTCRITVTSAGDTTVKDTLLATMVTV